MSAPALSRIRVKVLNIHERALPESPQRVSTLIDALSSPEDALWPNQSWPRMTFDRPLRVGADGGHGPIRYFVEAYIPGQRIRFRFSGPRGFDGHHEFAIVGSSAKSCVLRHTLEMITRGPALVSWPFVFRPLHNALIEDSLAVAQASLGHTPRVQPWPARVRILRWLASRGRAPAQVTPSRSSHGTVLDDP